MTLRTVLVIPSNPNLDYICYQAVNDKRGYFAGFVTGDDRTQITEKLKDTEYKKYGKTLIVKKDTEYRRNVVFKKTNGGEQNARN